MCPSRSNPYRNRGITVELGRHGAGVPPAVGPVGQLVDLGVVDDRPTVNEIHDRRDQETTRSGDGAGDLVIARLSTEFGEARHGSTLLAGESAACPVVDPREPSRQLREYVRGGRRHSFRFE